jgi:hypothetical protein
MLRSCSMGALFLCASYAVTSGAITEVPFSEDPYVPVLTRKLCTDTLHLALFAAPVSGAAYWWRDESEFRGRNYLGIVRMEASRNRF